MASMTPAQSSTELAAAGTEKLTINLGLVDLGKIDLLVQEGFYSNRTDLIRTAVRNHLALHTSDVEKTIARRSLALGLQHFTRAQLESLKTQGVQLDIHVVGLARIAADVPPDLAAATIRSIVVLGALQASPAVRHALAERIS
jgi:Arc/MetJ-type ribon-helix-helix transcriptional regulator